MPRGWREKTETALKQTMITVLMALSMTIFLEVLSYQ